MNNNFVITNINLSNIIKQIASYIHEQCVQIRKDVDIEEGFIRLYSDYAIYPTDDDEYYCFHYVVHVDNKSERFFIVTWTPATQDEYLDSIKH